MHKLLALGYIPKNKITEAVFAGHKFGPAATLDRALDYLKGFWPGAKIDVSHFDGSNSDFTGASGSICDEAGRGEPHVCISVPSEIQEEFAAKLGELGVEIVRCSEGRYFYIPVPAEFPENWPPENPGPVYLLTPKKEKVLLAGGKR